MKRISYYLFFLILALSISSSVIAAETTRDSQADFLDEMLNNLEEEISLTNYNYKTKMLTYYTLDKEYILDSLHNVSYESPELALQLPALLTENNRQLETSGEMNRSFSPLYSPSGYYKAVVVIESYADGDWHYSGSGYLISRDTIVTAAHVLWGLTSSSARIRVCPNGSSGGGSVYGINDITIPTEYHEYTSGYETQEENNDWCIAKLSSSVSTSIGYFGFSVTNYPYTSMVGKSFVLSGYPQSGGGYLLYKSTGTGTSETHYRIWTNGTTDYGESGGPIFSESTGVSWGIITAANASGVKINPYCYTLLLNARNNSKDATMLVFRLYVNCLGRYPDVNGFNNWVTVLRNGTAGGKSVSHGFFFSSEYISRNRTNTQFVTDLYRTLLDRDPEAEGLANWLGALGSGYTRLDVFNEIADSQEFANLCANYGINP